jgi:hypothetical protein
MAISRAILRLTSGPSRRRAPLGPRSARLKVLTDPCGQPWLGTCEMATVTTVTTV